MISSLYLTPYFFNTFSCKIFDLISPAIGVSSLQVDDALSILRVSVERSVFEAGALFLHTPEGTIFVRWQIGEFYVLAS